ERATLQPFDERPLVRVHGPARCSPMSPEIEHHHLAPVVTQPELPAADILALDLWSKLANRQTSNLKQLSSGSLRQSSLPKVDGAVLLDGLFEKRLGLLGVRIGAVFLESVDVFPPHVDEPDGVNRLAEFRVFQRPRHL